MSKPFKAAAIIRCPFCHSGAQPAHLGQNAMVCEACGQQFRVVSAKPGETGAALTRFIDERKRVFAPRGRNVGRR